jgi:hypothetical protein
MNYFTARLPDSHLEREGRLWENGKIKGNEVNSD